MNLKIEFMKINLNELEKLNRSPLLLTIFLNNPKLLYESGWIKKWRNSTGFDSEIR